MSLLATTYKIKKSCAQCCITILQESTIVSQCVSFDPLKSGDEVWKPLLAAGRLKSSSGSAKAVRSLNAVLLPL